MIFYYNIKQKGIYEIPINFTDNTNKKFICVLSGYEPKDILSKSNNCVILEHWFVNK